MIISVYSTWPSLTVTKKDVCSSLESGVPETVILLPWLLMLNQDGTGLLSSVASMLRVKESPSMSFPLTVTENGVFSFSL